MLDTDTKRRIDTARDILIGKVPDPKSQVEQITIALIYKFMDDMDAGSEELGGKRKFFTGDFARYGWARLMDRSLGGHEMLGLYGEGIAKMPENPGPRLRYRRFSHLRLQAHFAHQHRRQGAQHPHPRRKRRAFTKNDLPHVQAELSTYLHALRAKASTDAVLSIASTAQIVKKEKIAANGDYNLEWGEVSDRAQREAIVSGAAQLQLPIRNLNGAKIPLPPLATQQAIVAEIEAEQALVAANRELITRFEQKIQDTLERVWGEVGQI